MILVFLFNEWVVQSAGSVEYSDYISVERWDPSPHNESFEYDTKPSDG